MVQQEAEGAIIAAANLQEGLHLVAGVALDGLPNGLVVTPDAVDLEAKVVMEVYSRIGALKTGHKRKVQSDLLKLALIGRVLGDEWRRIMCFASEDAAKSSMNQSWTTSAAREFGIDIIVAAPPDDIVQDLIQAQTRQTR